ncbi:unnamed protein product [Amoebophrya sp. A25]|nr:unnamed protein product [Amoebophrya sp. A25]|eukprot:GSA25T00016678001.1
MQTRGPCRGVASASSSTKNALADAIADIRFARQRRRMLDDQTAGLGFPLFGTSIASTKEPVTRDKGGRPTSTILKDSNVEENRTRQRNLRSPNSKNHYSFPSYPLHGDAAASFSRPWMRGATNSVRKSQSVKIVNNGTKPRWKTGNFDREVEKIWCVGRPPQPVIESPLHVSSGKSVFAGRLKKSMEPRDAMLLFLDHHNAWLESQNKHEESSSSKSSSRRGPENWVSRSSRSPQTKVVEVAQHPIRPVEALDLLAFLEKNADFNRSMDEWKQFLNVLELTAKQNGWPAPILQRIFLRLAALRSKVGGLAFWSMCVQKRTEFGDTERVNMLWSLANVSRAKLHVQDLSAMLEDVDVSFFSYGQMYRLLFGLVRIHFGVGQCPADPAAFPKNFSKLIEKCAPRMLEVLTEKRLLLEKEAHGTNALAFAGVSPRSRNDPDNEDDLEDHEGGPNKTAAVGASPSKMVNGSSLNSKYSFRLMEVFGRSAVQVPYKLHYGFISVLDINLDVYEYEELGTILDVFRFWCQDPGHGSVPKLWLRAKKRRPWERRRPRKENYGSMSRGAKHIWEFVFRVERAMKLQEMRTGCTPHNGRNLPMSNASRVKKRSRVVRFQRDDSVSGSESSEVLKGSAALDESRVWKTRGIDNKASGQTKPQEGSRDRRRDNESHACGDRCGKTASHKAEKRRESSSFGSTAPATSSTPRSVEKRMVHIRQNCDEDEFSDDPWVEENDEYNEDDGRNFD